MRTPSHLWLLLSLVAAPVFAQEPASPDPMRVDPATQRERDRTRVRILQDELATETRGLATSQNELRDAEASRAASGRVQEITERIALHRENVAALEREMGLAERPAYAARSIGLRDAGNTGRGRLPDDWLIPGQRLTVAKLNDVQARRRLPLAAPEVKRPAWIIRSGLPGMTP